VLFGLGSSAWGLTREIAELRRQPLTLRRSVINQLTADILKDPYDEFLRRPYNLSYVNLERLPNLSPWPGQEGEQNRYVDFLIGNNGNSNVRAGADTLQGTYIGQSSEKFSWGVSGAYLTDDFENSNGALGATFTDGGELTGGDLRFGMGFRISNRVVLGGGVGAYTGTDKFEDGNLSPGLGGSYALQESTQTGFEADFGFRLFTGQRSSWDARLLVGSGETEVDDLSQILDGGGAITDLLVNKDYDLTDTYIELAAGYNRTLVESDGEWQIRGGIRQNERELDNTLLGFADDGTGVVANLTLLGQDPVTTREIFISADTLFTRGWTQIFASARVMHITATGSTTADASGFVVNEAIDDSQSGLGLIMGLRQPLWNEQFRLVARARADWTNTTTETTFDVASSGRDTSQTSTRFAIGIETVLNNMVFDVAWLFGGDPAPGGAAEPSRQIIDLDRLVISATFGW
jgi:hypothetical protein